MKRKSFLNRLALASGGTVFLPSLGLLQGCEYVPAVRTDLDHSDLSFLNEIAETILPATPSSPGAKEAKVGHYMLSIFRDCMVREEQAVFLEGLNQLDARSAIAFEASFMDAQPREKLEILQALQAEAISYNLALEGVDHPLPHYFDLFKSLTISGYFTSETGMTIARSYLPLPGKYEACIPYTSGDKPWAT
ncbi:MAG TPA: gluconate 2-dehydrogenase subunit 3 family protein [Eudoraea sp.]|nr:gluconate 2-dehydrogenase subunit 3 family protein [Eudoraea sp.]